MPPVPAGLARRAPKVQGRARRSCSPAPSDAGIHAARVENALGIEALLDARGEARERRLLRLKDRDRGAQARAAPDQRRMPARGGERGADRRGAAIGGAAAGGIRDRQPQQTARPVGEPGEVELGLERIEQRRGRRGRARDPPERQLARQQGDVPDLAPERERRARVELLDARRPRARAAGSAPSAR